MYLPTYLPTKLIVDLESKSIKYEGNCCKQWVGAIMVLRLWEETRDLNVVGSNPSTVNWMDIFSHIFIV